jgi:tRNA nucleotidyltransferase (CCA-adding enzyme)
MKTFNIGPCAEIGIIKTQIKDAILEGDIANDYTEAVEEMLRIGLSLGLIVHCQPAPAE